MQVDQRSGHTYRTLLVLTGVLESVAAVILLSIDQEKYLELQMKKKHC